MKRWFVIGLVLGLCGIVGCGALGSNVDKEATSQLGGAARQSAERAPGVAASGQGPVTITMGTDALEQMREQRESELGLNTGHTYDVSIRNPFTLAAIGLGLILLAIGLVKLWNVLKNTSIGKAAELADQRLKAQIDALKAKMAATTDATVVTTLKDAVIEAEAARDANYAATTTGG